MLGWFHGIFFSKPYWHMLPQLAHSTFLGVFELTVLALFVYSLWHLVCLYPSLTLKFSSCIPCRANLIVINSPNMFLIKEKFYFSFNVMATFAGYNCGTLYLWSFRISNSSFLSFLAWNFLSKYQGIIVRVLVFVGVLTLFSCSC